ncbi:MAG: TonB-dependent receptor [Chlorobi bacterium]|nr:TonB-dependent receptor [Chlorobiota bacterium]
MTKILTALLSVIYLNISAQIITVTDETDLHPIENVIISGKNDCAITDKDGKADISFLDKENGLIFKHPAYADLKLTFAELKKQNYKVKLIESVLDINEVVVSANSWEQNKNEVSNRIKIISERTIANTVFQTSADMLKASGEVFVQKSQLGGGSPLIRGYAANRILLVVDGVRMNNAIYRSGNLQNIISVDANSIESSEIILGPGSVIYGSDAIGGVIDLHTLKPEFAIHEKKIFSGNIAGRFSSADKEKTGHADFNLATENTAFLTSFSYSDYDDLKMGSNGGHDEYLRKEYIITNNGIDMIIRNSDEELQKFSGFSQLSLIQKISHKFNNRLKLNYAFYYSETSDVPRYDRLLQYSDGHLKYAEWYYGPQKWLMHNIGIECGNKTKLFDKFKFTVAYQDYEESRHDRKYLSDEIRERYEDVKALSFNLDAEKQISEKSYIYYGAEAILDKVYSSGTEKNIFTGEKSEIASRYPDDSDWNEYAVYASFKNNISDITTLSAGLRYNIINIYAQLDTVFYDFPFTETDLNTGALNGNLGITVRPETWLFKFNAGTGFRAPNIDDMAKIFDSEPGSVIVPNDDLRPEYIYNIDLGISKTFADKFQIDAAIFSSYLDNALVRDDFTFNGQDSVIYDGELSKVQAVVNADYAFVYGFTVSLNADISENLSIKSSFNFTKGKDSDDKPLRHVAPPFGSTHFIFKADKLRADLYFEYNGEISYDDLADSERDKTYMYAEDENGNPYSPAWYTANFILSYQFNKKIGIKAAAENITDMRYRPYSSGIAAPGINFMFSVSASF